MPKKIRTRLDKVNPGTRVLFGKRSDKGGSTEVVKPKVVEVVKPKEVKVEKVEETKEVITISRIGETQPVVNEPEGLGSEVIEDYKTLSYQLPTNTTRSKKTRRSKKSISNNEENTDDEK